MNPYRLHVKLTVGSDPGVALEFYAPTSEQVETVEQMTQNPDDTTAAEIEKLLWDLLISATVEGHATPDDWKEQLRDSGIMRGGNAVEVAKHLFFRRNQPVVVRGLD